MKSLLAWHCTNLSLPRALGADTYHVHAKQTVRELLPSINLTMTNDNITEGSEAELNVGRKRRKASGKRQESRGKKNGNYKSCKCHWVNEEIKFPSQFPLHIPKH